MTNSLTVRPRRAADGWTCEVQVSFPGGQTRHEVSVTRGDLARWGRGEREDDVVELVRRSFDFLLEREPPTSILRSFDLAVIQRYFPEYDEEIGTRGGQ